MIKRPKDPVALPLTSFFRRRDIREEGLDPILANQHFLWATQGGRSSGYRWATGGWNTTSTSFTTINGTSSTGWDLDSLNMMITPSRVEIDAWGTNNPGDKHLCVEVLAYVSNIELEAGFYGLEDGAILPDVAERVATVATANGSPTLVSTTVMLNRIDGVEAWQIRLRARLSGTGTGRIHWIVARECPYPSENTYDVGVYGSPYVANQVTGSTVTAWDHDELGAGSIAPVAGTMTLVSNGVRPGFNSVSFPGNPAYMASPPINHTGADGIIISCLMKSTTTSGIRFAIERNVPGGYAQFIYASGTNIVSGVRTSGGLRTRTLSGVLPASTWVDVTLWWRRSTGEIRAWANDTSSAPTAFTAGETLNESLTPWNIGRWGGSANYWWLGELAFPHTVIGDFDLAEVQRVRAWRRSIHGMY